MSGNIASMLRTGTYHGDSDLQLERINVSVTAWRPFEGRFQPFLPLFVPQGQR